MPSSTPPSTPPSPYSNPLVDIFSDSPPTTPSQTSQAVLPSDIERLRSIHSTAGYREGVSASKDQSLQPGFDEGYSLGARFGIRVGQLLGTLEGLRTALEASKSDDGEFLSSITRILSEAKHELSLESIFARNWWGEDGLWKYDVKSSDPSESSEEDRLSFLDIVESHPLIIKWHGLTEHEVEAFGIQKSFFDGEDWETGRVGTE